MQIKIVQNQFLMKLAVRILDSDLRKLMVKINRIDHLLLQVDFKASPQRELTQVLRNLLINLEVLMIDQRGKFHLPQRQATVIVSRSLVRTFNLIMIKLRILPII